MMPAPPGLGLKNCGRNGQKVVMNWAVIVLGGSAVSVAFIAGAIMRQGNRALILPEQLQRLIRKGENMLLLDVRSAREFSSGHLPGAVLLPYDRLLSAPDQVPRQGERMIIVYCERGPRARLAQRALIKSGFSNVLHLRGDMSAWRARGLPIEASGPGHGK